MPEAWLGLGNILSAQRSYDQALANYDKALALSPQLADAWIGAVSALTAQKRHPEAVASYYRLACAIRPDAEYALGLRLLARMQICDWTDFAARRALLAAAIDQDAVAIMPFHALPLSQTPSSQLACARRFGRDNFPLSTTPLWRGECYAHDRIRVAYLSTDFRDHPVAYLTAGLFGRHDRSRFETIGMSLGHDEFELNA